MTRTVKGNVKAEEKSQRGGKGWTGSEAAGVVVVHSGVVYYIEAASP